MDQNNTPAPRPTYADVEAAYDAYRAAPNGSTVRHAAHEKFNAVKAAHYGHAAPEALVVCG